MSAASIKKALDALHKAAMETRDMEDMHPSDRDHCVAEYERARAALEKVIAREVDGIHASYRKLIASACAGLTQIAIRSKL